ncbi:MAG: hypothetical protein NC413_12645 [Muribaculum sp.]|nr:hypothetical protein [Muribaculum sp.]
MGKKCVLAIIMVMVMGMCACSFGAEEETGGAGEVFGSGTIQTKEPGTTPSDTEPVSTEVTNADPTNASPTSTEPSGTKVAESNEKEDPNIIEVPQGDPIVALVDSYEDNIIVLRDLDDEDIIYYFSTQDAELIEGDSPIAAGDIVEITYQGGQGNKEHPGTAVKVVAESEMYK